MYPVTRTDVGLTILSMVVEALGVAWWVWRRHFRVPRS